MIFKTDLRKASTAIIIGILAVAMVSPLSSAAPFHTTLSISAIDGGLGSVSVSVKNTGNETATNFTIIISVSGGLFHRVNLTKICSGCPGCGTTIEPNATKTESTREAGRLFGLGPIQVTVSAEAINAEKVTATASGFILGPLVVIR